MNQIYNSFLALIVCFGLTLIFGKILIPMLKKAKVGQHIREDGPKSHYAKQGTPTMGGVMIALAVIITAFIFGLFKGRSGLVLLSMPLFGTVGFVDDYFKLVLKRSLGLDERQKLIMQFVFAICILTIYSFIADNGLFAQRFPFVQQRISFSVLIYPIMIFIFLGVVNAVNLTDGLDGLVSGVSQPVFLTIAIIAFVLKQQSVGVLAFAFVGTLMGFLFFNANPASVYMGDTGSMALGGAIAGFALVLDIPFYLPLLGGIFMVEALSVIIQTVYFRKTGGKRIFLMSPIHHHFELKGYKEPKIVTTFSQVSILLCVLTLLLFFYSFVGGKL